MNNLKCFKNSKINFKDSYLSSEEDGSGILPVLLKEMVTSNVTNMKGMFQGYKGHYINLRECDGFTLENVTDVSYMFAGLKDLTQTQTQTIMLPEYNLSNVTDMSYMFYDSTSLYEFKR